MDNRLMEDIMPEKEEKPVTTMKVDGAEGISGVRDIKVEYPGNPNEVVIKVDDSKKEKPSLFWKAVDLIFETKKEDMKTYVKNQAKSMVRDAKKRVLSGLGMAFLNDGSFFEKDKGGDPRDKTSYDAYYKKNKDDVYNYYSATRKKIEDIRFRTEQEADDFLTWMRRYIDRNDNISIAVVYSEIGRETTFSQNRYGWVSMRGIYSEPDGKGWLIVFPDAKLIE